MAGLKIYNNNAEKMKYYSAFDGVDFVSPFSDVSEKHSPMMINMIRDYDNGGVLRTRPRIAMYKEKRGYNNYILEYNGKIVERARSDLYYDGNHILLSGENMTESFKNKNASRSLCIEYKNKLYFYENDGADTDVYIFDGTELTKFSDKLDMFIIGMKGDNYFNETFVFPSTYTKNDYSQADFVKAYKFVAKHGTLTEEEKIKYYFPINHGSGTGTTSEVVLADVMTISNIIEDKTDTKVYFTKADIDKAFPEIGKTLATTSLSYYEFMKYDVDRDGTITNEDFAVIKATAAKTGTHLDTVDACLAPITFINGIPLAANADYFYPGTAYERINLLSPYFINTFTLPADITLTKHTFELSLPEAYPIGYQIGEDKNAVMITSSTPGTLSIEFDKNINSEKTLYVLCRMPDAEYQHNLSIIGDMRIAQVFDDRVFMSGAEVESEYVNRLMHSNIDNPLYFPDNAYYEDVMGSGKITALLPVKTQLAVIKQDIDQKNAIYMHTPTSTQNELAPRMYPSTYGMFDTGCINSLCYGIFNGESVFVSKKGLMAFSSTDLSTERSIQPRSSLLGNIFNGYTYKKTSETSKSNSYYNIFITITKDRLYMFTDKEKIYVADAHNAAYNKKSQAYEYEWFMWKYLNNKDKYEGVVEARTVSSCSIDETLYFCVKYRFYYSDVISSIESNIYKFTYDFMKQESGADAYLDENEIKYSNGAFSFISCKICSCIATPFYSFGYPQYFKNTSRTGNVANMYVYNEDGPLEYNIKFYSKTSMTEFKEPKYDYVKDVWTMDEGSEIENIVGQYWKDTKVHRQNTFIFRPYERGWLDWSVIIFSPQEPIIFYDITLTAVIKKQINNIF